MSASYYDSKSQDGYDTVADLVHDARSQVKSLVKSTTTVQPPTVLPHQQQQKQQQQQQQQQPRSTQQPAQHRQEPQQAQQNLAPVVKVEGGAVVDVDNMYIYDAYTHALEDKYGSLFAGRQDPVEVWVPSTRYNPISRTWDRPVTTQYLLNTLSVVHKLLPHHLGVHYVPPLVGEIDFGATSRNGNRFFCLSNMDHDIQSTSYTNTSKTPEQLNLTRASGQIPPLIRSNSILDNILVNLYTSNPDAINPANIDRVLAPFPIESANISLSNLDIVPVVVHHNQKTVTTTEKVDPVTLHTTGPKRTTVVNQKLPDTVAWARGTSVQRVLDTRNSGMLPDLVPNAHLHNFIPLSLSPGADELASMEPTIIVTNPLSNEKITLSGSSSGSSPADQLTQAEVNSLSDMICIYRNRNFYRGANSYHIAQDFVQNLSHEIVEHVRADLDRQYNAEIIAVQNATKQQQRAKNESIKLMQQEASQAYNEKQSIINSAIADMELQCKEAQRRLSTSSRESSKAEAQFKSQFSTTISTLENELAQLKAAADQISPYDSNDPTIFDKEYHAAAQALMDKYHSTLSTLKNEWDRLNTALNQTGSDLENNKAWDLNTAQSALRNLADRTTALLREFNLFGKDKRLAAERDVRFDATARKFGDLLSNYNSIITSKHTTVMNQDNLLAGLRQKLIQQRSIMTERVEQARSQLHTIQLEGCYEIPGTVEVIETKIPVEEVHYVKETIKVPVVKQEYHWEVVSDPQLITTTKAVSDVVKGPNDNNAKTTTTTTTATTTTNSKSNRNWLGSIADATRAWFSDNSRTETNHPSTTQFVESEGDTITSNNHIYNFALNNYDSIIGTDESDSEINASFERFASLTDDE